MVDCQEAEFIKYIAPDAVTPTDPFDQWRAFYPIENVRDILWYIGELRSPSVADERKVFFAEKVAQWKKDTEFTSSSIEIILHPAYQDILGMGEDALPLIFSELEANGGQWFWALRHITKKDPVKIEDRGKTKKMREAWLEWGRQHNYL
jgi:hypothetical protein